MSKKSSQINYKKIKYSSLLGSIVTFFIGMTLGGFVLILGYELLYSYVMESKAYNEYKDVTVMAGIYDKYDRDYDSADNIYNLLDEFDREYMVTDALNNVLMLKGENTCSFNGGTAILSNYPNTFTFYQDSERPALRLNKKGKIVINNADLNSKDELSGYEYTVTIAEDDNIFDENFEELNVSPDSFEKLINMPYWISVPVKDGSENLVVKCYFKANSSDVFTATLLIVGIGLILLFAFIAFLVSAIRGFIRYHRISQLYYKDDVTKGNNWKWFVIKGEQRLRKRKTARNRYAVLNLVFVNYRNYCVCHSIEDGEELLKKIYEQLQKDITAGEMCVRSASASFSLLLICQDDNSQLEMRINDIINHLEYIDQNHKFSFQVGVDFIERSMNPSGRPVRRTSINLDTEYNKACTARNEIADSDDSGIRFFDESLVQNQKWLEFVQSNQQKAVNNEEFKVYYQPKYDPRTNELRGAEALIRWESPEYGFITPGKFIPIFEKNGFITEIDHYMIRHVARDQKKWLDEGLRCVPVSVNVSRAHFAEKDLADQIRDMVDEAGAPHNLVEIELTESAFFDDKKAMVSTINNLKGYGFSVSMDDFGSGYSSLNSLKDMPLDVLKLDAEFFRGEFDSQRGEVVVSEAIKLAKNLNMRTVAEGVEVKEQVDFLAGEGCDMIQGYYYAKPMPKNEYEDRLSKNNE